MQSEASKGAMGPAEGAVTPSGPAWLRAFHGGKLALVIMSPGLMSRDRIKRGVFGGVQGLTLPAAGRSPARELRPMIEPKYPSVLV